MMRTLSLLWAKARERKELLRLASRPRFSETTTFLAGKNLRVPDGPSFASAYEEIFLKKIYAFAPSGKSPRILDCGANVGLGVLFWKQQHPGSRITAFEADPKIAEVLRHNLAVCKVAEVEVVEAAVWSSDGRTSFQSQGADAGRLGDGGIEVSTVALRPYLEEPIDLLKIDIEGAELGVLRSCRGALGSVRHLFVEYHSFAAQPQRLPELLEILAGDGFRYVIHTVFGAHYPFVRSSAYLGMDLQLNIFAYRSECVSST